MSLIASDRFASGALEPWWQEHQPELLTEPAAIISGRCRLRCDVGGASGSFHYHDDDGYMLYQQAIGDFDVVADMESLSYDETGVPPSTSAARLLTLAVHSPVKPESAPQYRTDVRVYYHRGIGRAPGATVVGDPIVVEWKSTRANQGTPPPISFSTWDTLVAPSQLTARCWMRVRREGTLMRSWHAPFSASIPEEDDWLDEHSIDLPELPPLVQIGFTLYSSSADADVCGRIYSVHNYGI